MTIEIRELVIEARVSDSQTLSQPWASGNPERDREEEARWVELITRQVMEQLREELGRRL
ncbi:DUF5908 family protein [Yokenella regensburgei]|uniref:DUF5908 family protein n=1 Tax=Yokenella regensburgei TaxID=158877 RepID=UPI003ED93C20